MLYYYFFKKIIVNKWIYLSLLIILLTNLLILPLLNTNLNLLANNYQKFVSTFVLINLAIGIVFSALILIILFREIQDNGWSLWMSALPYSRNNIFISKLIVFFLFILVYSTFIPLIFLGMLNVSYGEELSKINSFYGIVNIGKSFGISFGILLGIYFFTIIFFSTIYLILNLYFKQLSIILIVFISTIGFSLLSLTPKIGFGKGNILQYDLEKKEIDVDIPMNLSIYQLDQEIANNQEIYNLPKMQEYLDFFDKKANDFDQLIFGPNSFSRLSINSNNFTNSRLNLLNPFTYLEILGNDLFEKNLNLIEQTYNYEKDKSKMLVAKNSNLTNASTFSAKEEILAKRFATLQILVNDFRDNIEELKSLILYLPNPINAKEIRDEIANLESRSNSIFDNYTHST